MIWQRQKQVNLKRRLTKKVRCRSFLSDVFVGLQFPRVFLNLSQLNTVQMISHSAPKIGKIASSSAQFFLRILLITSHKLKVQMSKLQKRIKMEVKSMAYHVDLTVLSIFQKTMTLPQFVPFYIILQPFILIFCWHIRFE